MFRGVGRGPAMKKGESKSGKTMKVIGGNRLCCNLYMNVTDKRAKVKFIQKMNINFFHIQSKILFIPPQRKVEKFQGQVSKISH